MGEEATQVIPAYSPLENEESGHEPEPHDTKSAFHPTSFEQ